MDGNAFVFQYDLDQQNPNKDAYLNFSVKLTEADNFMYGSHTNSSPRLSVNLHNITAPVTFNVTALEMMVSIVGGNEPSTGTYIPYRILSTADFSTSSPATTTGRSKDIRNQICRIREIIGDFSNQNQPGHSADNSGYNSLTVNTN